MRKILSTIGLAALMSSAALAGSNAANLSVTASITSTCTISASGGLGLGAYDPIGGAAVNATGIVATACTTDVTAPYLTLDQGLHPAGGSTAGSPLRQLSDGAGTPHYLSYNIYSDSGHSVVFGNTGTTGTTAPSGTGTAQNTTIYGQIASGQHTAPAGTYADTVVATVTF